VRAHFCGTRGSTPAPGPAFVRYGGHTSCLALSLEGDAAPTLLLDAGTGVRAVTGLLGGRPFIGTVLLTHLHWDHVQGIPFFEGGDRDDAFVRLLMPAQEDGADPEEVLARMMAPPLFPIWPKDLRGSWTFGVVPKDAFTGGATIEGFTVDARDVPHKGGRTLGFRVSDGRHSLAYIPDHCPTTFGPGPAACGEYHPAALELARDVDVLVHDAQLRADEVPEQGSFGHAAAEYAVGLAQAAGAKSVQLFHHRPDRSDDEVDVIAAHLTSASLPVYGAAEGTTLEL
jgi:phosphoribosyl 1,2-cyclic phosphodiesterase